MSIITLTTDFGDVYPAIMKGVILSIHPGAKLVDISHSVRPGDVRGGAFILRFASGHFSPGSVHLAVVDPSVGGRRRAIVIKGEKYSFVGPDNGLLMPAARAQGAYRVYEISDLSFYARKVSPVFHGRDVFAPAAAFLSKGHEIPCLREITDPVDLDFGVPELKDDKVVGKVIYVDGFGNVITNIGGEALSGLLHLGMAPKVNDVEMPFVRAYCDAPRRTLVLLVGSHGMAEIACNGDSASTLMGLGAGDMVTISFQ
ncbi:SAM hydrolase/SAM-dependent halogenase family protein [Methanocella conradii]|uniref:SAM hydrolase/SAM-dependent halogenase family protein n=1 Tax=Methanocella conradii TaxID=1175444 RepID=UPI00157BC6B8|nr:SAM-dependent chlorinase/fluorinase [Methanocella conradii]